VSVGVLMRRILHMGTPERVHVSGLAPLRGDRLTIYQPLAKEIEAHTTILGITLNDAFSEREAGRHEIAWHTVRLAVGEWNRLIELIMGLQNVLAKFLPSTNGIVPLRRVAANHFKSRTVIDYVGFYEFLDQILFSSKRRFSLQLRVLLRASVLLSKDFRKACREGECMLDSSEELWTRLDFFFHDFDLIAKETLLSFRTLLACQSTEGVQELALELENLLESGVRVSIPASHQ
jgi:hypothetical protein